MTVKRMRLLIGAGAALFLVLVFGRSAALLYTEHLWFVQAGHAPVFWTRIVSGLIIRTIAAVVAAAIIYVNLALVLRRLGPVRLRRRYGNLEIAEQIPRLYVTVGSILIALFGGWWLAVLAFGGNAPLDIWAWFNHVQWGERDPLFSRDLSFYVFTLPALLRFLDHLLIALFWSALLIIIGYGLIGALRVAGNRFEFDPYARSHFAGLAAAFLCVLALRFLVSRYLFAVDGTGFHGAPGYTDVHARIFAFVGIAFLCVIAAAAILWGDRRSLWAPPALGIGLLFFGAILLGYAYPTAVQTLQVRPNELIRERPYIEWNLEYTRKAFGLTDVTRTHMTYHTASSATWAAASPVMDQLALLDVDQLKDAFDQVQSFRAYYGFTDVDFDRYALANGMQQVGIGVREFQKSGLDNAAKTWVNQHMTPEFTRGLGTVVAETDVALLGAPSYLIGELTPIRTAPAAAAIALQEPALYYGELTDDYIVLGADGGADSASASSPNDETALPSEAALRSGVPIGSFLRRLLFAWRFGDQNLLFARSLDSNSRILYNRIVRERVKAVAPFFVWDRDALPVIVDGRVQWILDGYTASSYFPLSSRRQVTNLEAPRVNYLRGNAKATVDAVTGEINVYATDGGDPILRTYQSLFPGLVKATSAMPSWLVQHLRYPPTLLTAQAAVLEQYHVQQPNVFYAGQDAWQVPAQGATAGTPRPDEPLFMFLEMPGANTTEFVTMLPFIARERQNLTALLIAQNDPGSYGKLTLLDLSGDEQIKGPGQVQSLIEQDPEISQQLSLWRQLGTAVELGQLRIVPTDSSILYIEPLFLAAEDKAIPQLQRVLVSDGINVAMAETLNDAIASLTGVAQPTAQQAAPPGTAAPDARAPAAGRSAEALRLYEEAERHLRNGDFAAFGATWRRLRTVLQKDAGDGQVP